MSQTCHIKTRAQSYRFVVFRDNFTQTEREPLTQALGDGGTVVRASPKSAVFNAWTSRTAIIDNPYLCLSTALPRASVL